MLAVSRVRSTVRDRPSGHRAGDEAARDRTRVPCPDDRGGHLVPPSTEQTVPSGAASSDRPRSATHPHRYRRRRGSRSRGQPAARPVAGCVRRGDLGRGHRRPVGDRRSVDASTASSLRPSLLVSFAIAALGVAWAMWPSMRCRLATAVAALSLLQTSEASQRRPADRRLHRVRRDAGAARSGAHPPRRSRAGRSRALVVLAAESVSLRADDTPIRAIIAMSMLVLLGAATAAVVYIRLRDSERRTSIENARYNERLDLARELHDVVGHHVTGIVVLAQANRFTSGAEPSSAADRALADIEAAGLETLTSVRRLIGLLRTDPSTATGPRLTDIEQLVEDLRSTHPSTDLIIDDAVRADWVPADLATTVHRLVQEAATNVRRHGDPRSLVQFTMRSNGAVVRAHRHQPDAAPHRRRRLRVGRHARTGRRARRHVRGRSRGRRPVDGARRTAADRATRDEPRSNRATRSPCCSPTIRRWCGPGSG